MKKAEPDLTAALEAFVKEFSYPAQQGLSIRNLPQHPVHARTDRGNAAAYFSFPNIKNLEAHVSEIPPGGATPTHRHTCEAFFYVIFGCGYTEVHAKGGNREAHRVARWRFVLHANPYVASACEPRSVAASPLSGNYHYSSYEVVRKLADRSWKRSSIARKK